MFVGQFECFESIQKAELHAAIFFSLQVSAARRVINCFLLIQEYCWLSKWEGEKKKVSWAVIRQNAFTALLYFKGEPRWVYLTIGQKL